MKYKIAVALAVLVAFSMLAMANVEESDNVNVPVPTQNGTSSNTTVTGRMQQYVGFYGNLTFQVRNNTNVGNVLYYKTVTYGKLYFFKTGAIPTEPFTAAPTSALTNSNFSLTGFYNTSNHFDTQATVCGINSVNKLNTTDNRTVGIFYDAATTPNYFVCTDVGAFTSGNGFGTISYEIIVPKTTSYLNYDIWYNLD